MKSGLRIRILAARIWILWCGSPTAVQIWSNLIQLDPDPTLNFFFCSIGVYAEKMQLQLEQNFFFAESASVEMKLE